MNILFWTIVVSVFGCEHVPYLQYVDDDPDFKNHSMTYRAIKLKFENDFMIDSVIESETKQVVSKKDWRDGTDTETVCRAD